MDPAATSHLAPLDGTRTRYVPQAAAKQATVSDVPSAGQVSLTLSMVRICMLPVSLWNQIFAFNIFSLSPYISQFSLHFFLYLVPSSVFVHRLDLLGAQESARIGFSFVSSISSSPSPLLQSFLFCPFWDPKNCYPLACARLAASSQAFAERGP